MKNVTFYSFSRAVQKMRELINTKADKSIATQSANGLMSSTDKTKLDIVSNKNMLINSDFFNPVNQRGQKIYAGKTGYTIDRWSNWGNDVSLTINEGYITLTNNDSTLKYYVQIIENGTKLLVGKTLTFSLLSADETLYTITGTFPSVLSDSDIAFTTSTPWGYIRLQYVKSIKATWVVIGVNAKLSVDISRAKLELGSISTLANDPPVNYGVELAKCQRYYYQISSTSLADIGVGGFIGTNDFYGVVPIPVSMRVKPTVAYSSLKDITLRANGTILASTTSVAPDVSTNTSLTLRIQGNVGVRGEWGNIRLPANAWIAFDAEIY